MLSYHPEKNKAWIFISLVSVCFIKKHHSLDTHSIKIAVLIWWRWGELNPRPKAL